MQDEDTPYKYQKVRVGGFADYNSMQFWEKFPRGMTLANPIKLVKADLILYLPKDKKEIKKKNNFITEESQDADK